MARIINRKDVLTDNEIENILKFYKVVKNNEDIYMEIKGGWYSRCYPIYSNEKIEGFVIKLGNKGDIFHELEHVKRFLENKSQNEIIVELYANVSKLKYYLSKLL
ncbi:MAG: hypothetical protein QW641_02385 [Candidatus Aenigmatarchaeota archaeon]